MKINFKKIILTSFILVFFAFNCKIYALDNSLEVRNIIDAHKGRYTDVFVTSYINFKDAVMKKTNYEDINSGWAYFDDNNDKLIIGNSAATFCGYTMGDEDLSKYGYDLVAFGGVFDEDLVELFKLLGDKKYNQIIIFGGTNDLNIRAVNNYKDIELLYCETLINLVTEALQHMRYGNNDLYFIKLKPLVYNLDSDDKNFVNCFNNMAFEVNSSIGLYGFKTYDIPFDTTLEFSEHYVHYNKKIVYETLFNDLKN